MWGECGNDITYVMLESSFVEYLRLDPFGLTYFLPSCRKTENCEYIFNEEKVILFSALNFFSIGKHVVLKVSSKR